MIWLSLHPSPAGETSAFNKTRAFKSRRAGLFPFRIKPSSRSCSSALSRTTYLFTDFSRVAIVPSVARSVTEANHQILSNWLKRATRTMRLLSRWLHETWIQQRSNIKHKLRSLVHPAAMVATSSLCHFTFHHQL